MKKFSIFVLCVVFICTSIVLPAKAISVNYFNDFEGEIKSLAFEFIFEGENKGNIVNHILPTLMNEAVLKETTTSKNEFGDDIHRSFYEIPSAFYEKTLNENFAVANIDDFKSLHYPENNDGLSWTVHFIEEKNVYELKTVSRFCGWGSATIPEFYGYHTLPDGTYNAYCYEINRSYEKPDGAVLGVDYILHDGKPAKINDLYEFNISYNGEKVKFLSWKHVESIPNVKNLITADTKVDPPQNNTTSNIQTSSNQQNTTSSNKTLTSSQLENITSGSKAEGSNAMQSITSNQSVSNQSDNKTPSNSTSSQSSSSTTSNTNSSVKDDMPKQDIQTSSDIDIEKGEAPKQKPGIIGIVFGITSLVGVTVACFFAIKKKKQR